MSRESRSIWLYQAARGATSAGPRGTCKPVRTKRLAAAAQMRSSKFVIVLATLGIASIRFSPAQTGASDTLSLSADVFQRGPAKFEDELKKLADQGALFQLNYTGEYFGNVSGGFRRGAEYEGLLRLAGRFNLEKLALLPHMTFYVSALETHGEGLTNHYVHDLNVVSNIDAYDTVRLYELWLQYGGPLDWFSIRIGQSAADMKYFAADSSQLFVNSSFGLYGTIINDFTAPVYPVAAPGIRLRAKPSPELYLQLAAFDGNPGQQDIDNKHGVSFRLNRQDGALFLAEAKYRAHQKENARAGWDSTGGLKGTYTMGAFYATADFPDQHGAGMHRGNYGGYLSVDQQVYCPDAEKDATKGLTMFARFSVAPSDRNLVSWYFDSGFNYKGPFSGRDNDLAGLAFGYTRISDDAVERAGQLIVSRHEAVLEMTYQATLSDWFSVQPDLQYVFNPGATGATRNAAVAGLRFNVTF